MIPVLIWRHVHVHLLPCFGIQLVPTQELPSRPSCKVPSVIQSQRSQHIVEAAHLLFIIWSAFPRWFLVIAPHPLQLAKVLSSFVINMKAIRIFARAAQLFGSVVTFHMSRIGHAFDVILGAGSDDDLLFTWGRERKPNKVHGRCDDIITHCSNS